MTLMVNDFDALPGVVGMEMYRHCVAPGALTGGPGDGVADLCGRVPWQTRSMARAR